MIPSGALVRLKPPLTVRDDDPCYADREYHHGTGVVAARTYLQPRDTNLVNWSGGYTTRCPDEALEVIAYL